MSRELSENDPVTQVLLKTLKWNALKNIADRELTGKHKKEFDALKKEVKTKASVPQSDINKLAKILYDADLTYGDLKDFELREMGLEVIKKKNGKPRAAAAAAVAKDEKPKRKDAPSDDDEPDPKRTKPNGKTDQKGSRDRRHALVVGVADYEGTSGFTKLPKVHHDLAEMRTFLKNGGWKIYGVTNPTDQTEMNGTIAEFTEQVQKGDHVLFYFAGHGAENEQKRNQLFLANGNPLDLQHLYLTLRRRQLGLFVSIIDACRNTPEGRNAGKASGDWNLAHGIGLREYFLFPCAPGQKAYEGSEHGQFTGAILKHAKMNTDIDEWFYKVTAEVRKATLELATHLHVEPQMPWMHKASIDKCRLYMRVD